MLGFGLTKSFKHLSYYLVGFLTESAVQNNTRDLMMFEQLKAYVLEQDQIYYKRDTTEN